MRVNFMWDKRVFGSGSARRREGGMMRFVAVLLACVGLMLPVAMAQTGGEGAIQGTVKDASGAIIPGATVSARNVATGIVTARTASSDGLFNVGPLIPGKYEVTVTANGFATFKQENVTIDAMNTLGLNVTLKTGSVSETITVSDAPPQLNTTSSTLGGTIANSVYAALPLLISGSQQRDVTQFSNLLPGAQVNPGGRSSIIGGTAQRLGELYVDGLPVTTLSQQGDNRPIFNIVPLESIDEIKVVTSGFSAEYQGAGLENYNLKSGGNQYHGSIFGYFRNTAFDAWSFSSKPGGGNTQKVLQGGVLVTVPGPKPPEHQTELGFAVGGPVKIPFLFNGHDKLFFYATYDKFRSRLGVNPSSTTVPTLLMRQGDFTEVSTPIYDPTSQTCVGTTCTRKVYNGIKNGLPTANVIPASQISPISQYLQKFLPDPTITTFGTIQNNYLGGIPSGFDNWLYSGRADYNISARQTLSFAITGGNRHAVPYTGTANPPLPVPYYTSTKSTVAGHWAELGHTFTITPHLVNQFKYGFMNFGGPPVQNITQGTPEYAFTASGVTGVPAGQASTNFPQVTFSGANSPANWSTPNTQTTTNVSETFTALDNLNLLKGKHSMNFGGQIQWLQNNASTNDGPSAPTQLTYSLNDTANISGTSYAANTGYSYASFLVGAVNTSAATLQPFSLVGGRFRPGAVYFQDDFKVTSKLTLNLGLRWDYLPPYHEAQDRWSFMNPNLTNPLTGSLGLLQFAGHRGAGVSCECSSPVNTYWKDYGPRLGFAYSADEKTVFRGGWGILYSHAGGTGGAGGAGTGTGQAGFNSVTSFTPGAAGPSARPAFYLNNNAAFSAPNANFGGPNAVINPIAPITATSQLQGTGFFVCSGQTISQCNGATGTSGGNGTGIAFADPYLSGRAPEFSFYNFGMEREIIPNLTVAVNYVGSQSHFIAGAAGIRGYYAGQLDPKWLALGANLTKPATAANIAAAQTATGLTLPIPYPGYTAAAAVNTSATIQHMLVWKPQYGGTTDTWGTNVANANYNAFQLSISQRASHGLTLNINYTYSHNIDNAGTIRSGFAIPAAFTSAGKDFPIDRIDRSNSINSQPQNLSIFGVYDSPFGKGKIGSDHFLVRALLGGWQNSEIFQYSSGIPLALVGTCNSTENVGQGTCMPDANPNFSGSVRTNGGWGDGVTAATLGTKSYINGAIPNTTSGAGFSPTPTAIPCASTTGPFCNSKDYSIGTLGRIAPYGLRGPGIYRLSASLRRTFDITERAKFVFGVDCQNVTNTVTFGENASNNQIGVNVNSSALGTLNFATADARAFQFSGRFQF
jgi:Carboxypeptidase regulatory-like domain